MTRPHSQQIHCPNCHTWITCETSFGRWIRNNPRLDSSQGYCVVDIDYTVHRFKVHADRGFQLMMWIEVKTMGMELTEAQRDTLLAANELLRNRRATPTKSAQQAGNYVPVVARLGNGRRSVRAYGWHVLRFSGLGPDDSKEIWWDKKQIDQDTLTALLLFDLDPDTLRPIDLRSHHHNRHADIPSLLPKT